MRAAAAALLGLLAACGPGAEKKVFDAFRDTCNGLVGGGVTAQEAVQRFGFPATVHQCALAPQQPLRGGVDQCDYQAGPVCQVFWVRQAYDQSLCSPAGCYFWCEVRVPSPVDPPPATAVVCGAWFVSGQPCVPYTC